MLKSFEWGRVLIEQVVAPFPLPIHSHMKNSLFVDLESPFAKSINELTVAMHGAFKVDIYLPPPHFSGTGSLLEWPFGSHPIPKLGYRLLKVVAYFVNSSASSLDEKTCKLDNIMIIFTISSCKQCVLLQHL